jgi:hypothetical protein
MTESSVTPMRTVKIVIQNGNDCASNKELL